MNLWDQLHGAYESSCVIRRIEARLTGDDPLVAGVRPLAFVTPADLAAVVGAVTEGGRVLDLGCGSGGLAVWLAREKHCDVLGIDSSTVAVSRARERAQAHGVSARFETLDLVDLDVLSAMVDQEQFDVVVSVDAVHFSADLAATMDAAQQVVASNGQLVITAYEARNGGRQQWLPTDIAAHLDRSRFQVSSAEVDGWAEHERAFVTAMMEERAELDRELGSDLARDLCDEAAERLVRIPDVRRVLIRAVPIGTESRLAAKVAAR